MPHRPIDWQHCLELVGGKQDLAKKLLVLFMQHLPESQRRIHCALQENNAKRLAEEVHKLYGACCYCAVPCLTQVLDRLREAVKAAVSKEWAALRPLLDEEVEAICREYEKLVRSGVLE